MSHWADKPPEWADDAIDLDLIEESALAMAQSTIQSAMNASGISQSEMARRMKCNRSFVSRMLAGNHNLTVKTMAKSLAVCGFEVQMHSVPLEWNWVDHSQQQRKEVEPANAGSTILTTRVSIVEPTFAGK